MTDLIGTQSTNGTDPETQPKPRQSFADDIVGRFRSGYVIDDRPATLRDWRVTTGDPEVAEKIHDLLGGDAPQSWASKGEDNLEVFTASSSVEVILAGPSAIRQRMVLWGRSGNPIYTSDGFTKNDGTPDPDAELSFQERKQRGKDGIGPVPDIDITFRLAEEVDLGIFRFKTGAWSMAQDLVRDGTLERLAEIDGPTKAVLELEEVSFVAKNGPMKGKTVKYTKPVLKIKGADPLVYALVYSPFTRRMQKARNPRLPRDSGPLPGRADRI
ncbi:recombination directionality factor [Agromyces ramosus]|uniref:Uncharacterized protein n=1 Tax=Agromyces ramosus TaxID=33879 RepID=A0ABU0RCJ3_9MICO|nr:hypothetical protein [Agromyces ramosus]MDQ0895788.1 hypothetical protein [Agromyces ramosus]